MELNPVIRCVVQYLNVDDVKNCRLLNKNWSSEGLTVLKRRCKIVFTKECNGVERTPARFLDVFPCWEETAPFTAFKILGLRQEWSVSELDILFESQRDNIRELELEYVNLSNNRGVTEAKFDLTSWLSNSAMTRPNAKYNTKLSAKCQDGGLYTVLAVDISAIVNVKEIILRYFQLNLQEGIQINSTKLKIQGLACARNGKILTSICINDFVNFCKIKTLDIFCVVRRDISFHSAVTNLKLDMDKNKDLQIEYLRMHGVTTLNFENCSWTVEKLHMTGNSFVERTRMTIKELNFVTNPRTTIDFSVLPPTIEKLVVATNTQTCLCSDSIFLPWLKSLYLSGSCVLMLTHFSKYPIVDLHLQGPSRIPFDWIPKSVKSLQLEDIKFQLKLEDRALNLENLVVNLGYLDFQSEEIQEIFGAHFRTANLVLRLIRASIPALKFLRSHKSCLESNQRFYIGPFDWNDHEDFNQKLLSDHVDGKSNYYVFENRKGKAIDEKEFLKLERLGTVDI